MFNRSISTIKLKQPKLSSHLRLVFCENDEELLTINAECEERCFDQGNNDPEMCGSFEQLVEQFDHNNNRWTSPQNAKRKRRQLPKIPENKKREYLNLPIS